jgi:2-methylcitrate dehydratase PrpD
MPHAPRRAFSPYDKGWHPTATLGIFGTVAAAARLLRLTQEQTAMALGLAASLASGLKANFGTMTKPLHVGHTARNGLFAALMVQQGFTANPAALEARQGFLDATVPAPTTPIASWPTGMRRSRSKAAVNRG